MNTSLDIAIQSNGEALNATAAMVAGLRSVQDALAATSYALQSIAPMMQLRVLSCDATGKTEVTDAINAALKGGGFVYVPPGLYLVDALQSVQLQSNLFLILHRDAVLLAKPNSADAYSVLLADRVHDVFIAGGQVRGERRDHVGLTGEGGMGLRIRGAERVTVRDTLLADCWGDGVVAGPYKGVQYIVSRDVLLQFVTCTGNRRNGLSIGNVVGFRAEDSLFNDNGNDPDGTGPIAPGTSPFCGIDIEPDPDPAGSEAGECHQVAIARCIVSGNHVHGINVRRRVFDLTIDGSDLVGNRVCGLQSVGANGIALTNSRVADNGGIGAMIGKENIAVQVAGTEFKRNNGALDRATPIVATGYPVAGTKSDLSIGAANPAVGENTYR